MTDGDFFEQRNHLGKLTTVAYIETIQLDNIQTWREYPCWPSKVALGTEIEHKMRIPFYVVYHDPLCHNFVALRFTQSHPRTLNQQQYIDFLRML